MPRTSILSTILLSVALALPSALAVESAAAASKQAEARAEYDWTRSVERRVQSRMSRNVRNGKSAVSVVHLTVDREGNIESSEIVQATGDKYLDRVTDKTLEKIDELPALPDEISGEQVSLELRIFYAHKPRIEAILLAAS